MSDTPQTGEAETGEGLSSSDQLVLALDGFEGPIDVLLTMAREQKVDLARLSILQLADQYLAFIEAVGRVRLELAADYLVMAAWLAYLKSRLLLPEPDQEDPPAEDMAAALAFQLQRLEAMKAAAEQLMGRPRLGIDVFARGAPEELAILEKPVYQVSLYDLLRAYGAHKKRKEGGVLHMEPMRLFSIEDAVRRMGDLLGRMPDWATLSAFLPPGIQGTLMGRSALAATFAATLELAKAGEVELKQEGAFSPLFIRRVPR